MIDTPIMTNDSPVKALEVEAMTAYRTKYPAGQPWQELHADTRLMWLREIERRRAA